MFAMLVDDVFEIKDRGVIVCGYMDSSRYNVKLYDCLYDFYGNQFWVKGIEMPRCNLFSNCETLGLLIENHGKNKEYFRNKLLTSKFDVVFAYPANPLNKTLPDYDYEEEYELAVQMKYPVSLVDISMLESTDNVKLTPTNKMQRVIYRGNKLSAENYRKLYNRMAEQNYYLINTPEQYGCMEQYHRNCSEFEKYIPESNTREKTDGEVYTAFFLNGCLVGVTDQWNETCNASMLNEHERAWLFKIAEKINSNFFSIILSCKKEGILTISDICDGQTTEIPQWHIRQYYGKLYRTIKECRERYLDFDIPKADENCKLENITEFKTSVGKIFITDKDNNRIPFSVQKSVYCCPVQVFAEDNERLRYLLYPKHNYSISVSPDNLTIGEKYRAVFTGGRLECGDSDENTFCISGILGKYSFAFGAYVPNDSILNPDNYDEYLIEISDDYTGFDFELIDKSTPVMFEVAWLKNNDEPSECLSACECWVT